MLNSIFSTEGFDSRLSTQPVLSEASKVVEYLVCKNEEAHKELDRTQKCLEASEREVRRLRYINRLQAVRSHAAVNSVKAALESLESIRNIAESHGSDVESAMGRPLERDLEERSSSEGKDQDALFAIEQPLSPSRRLTVAEHGLESLARSSAGSEWISHVTAEAEAVLAAESAAREIRARDEELDENWDGYNGKVKDKRGSCRAGAADTAGRPLVRI